MPGPVGFVGDVEVGSFDTLAVGGAGLEQRVEGTAGEERALDRPGGLAGVD